MRHTRRKTHRSDANSSALVKAARKLGMRVELIGRPVDAIVGVDGKWLMCEFKSGDGGYTPDQIEFKAQCAAQNLPVLTWRTIQDVADCAFGVLGARG